MPGSDCASAQSDLGLRCPHMPSRHIFARAHTITLNCNIAVFEYQIQSNLVISNSLISNYRLSRSKTLVPVLT